MTVIPPSHTAWQERIRAFAREAIEPHAGTVDSTGEVASSVMEALAREGLAILHGLAGLDFVAFDVNTLSPLHDVGGMSAFLAATVVVEARALSGLRLMLVKASRRKNSRLYSHALISPLPLVPDDPAPKKFDHPPPHPVHH